MKKYAALFFAVALALVGLFSLLTASPHDRFAGYGCLGLAVLFVPIWLAQRRGD